MFGVDDRASIDLSGEGHASLEDAAGVLSFGGADPGAAVERRRAAVAFSTIQIQQHDAMAERCQACDRACAAAFGVARMTSCDHDFQGRGLREEREG